MAELQEIEKKGRAINAKFVAYMEKHRLYELFYEIAIQLMIEKPEDHVVFIKQYLRSAVKKLNISNIILIAPTSFDRIALAKVLQKELGVHPLTLKDLRNVCSQHDDGCHCKESQDLAYAMRKILENEATIRESGWILVDLPRTKREAQIFQRTGIIPTHVIQLIVSNDTEKSKICTDIFAYCKTCEPTNTSKNMKHRRYLKNLRDLREVYGHCLIEVEVGIRTINELGKDCAKLAKIKKHCGAPSLFRIALVGSRGSGCTTLAKYLAERFNLVHIDYDQIMEQARLQQNPLGKMLRTFEDKWGGRPKPELRIQVVEKYISEYECLKRGWVLTGYPKTVEDFKLLDLNPTPPNRVIFVEVNGDVCRERLLNRRYNFVTGSKHILSTTNYADNDDCKLTVHPRDLRLNVERDLQEYEENVTDMMRYAGESAIKIDGNEEERIVREQIEAIIMRPISSWQSRVPKPPPLIDPMNIEFDPCDEPDSSVFDNIRAPETTYTFI
ncbi:adenylate kinase 8 [Frieseomelitta varia]|uniref:adenylate kinase 8 n=1 Tax=Frieseomelitta varia TaxID=561572 RepID=UPI001CB6A44A|nr:adenylate kinase 8 [Frieseomelitta varia]